MWLREDTDPSGRLRGLLYSRLGALAGGLPFRNTSWMEFQ
eukprot:gene5958-2833_t